MQGSWLSFYAALQNDLPLFFSFQFKQICFILSVYLFTHHFHFLNSTFPIKFYSIRGLGSVFMPPCRMISFF